MYMYIIVMLSMYVHTVYIMGGPQICNRVKVTDTTIIPLSDLTGKTKQFPDNCQLDYLLGTNMARTRTPCRKKRWKVLSEIFRQNTWDEPPWRAHVTKTDRKMWLSWQPDNKVRTLPEVICSYLISNSDMIRWLSATLTYTCGGRTGSVGPTPYTGLAEKLIPGISRFICLFICTQWPRSSGLMAADRCDSQGKGG